MHYIRGFVFNLRSFSFMLSDLLIILREIFISFIVSFEVMFVRSFVCLFLQCPCLLEILLQVMEFFSSSGIDCCLFSLASYWVLLWLIFWIPFLTFQIACILSIVGEVLLCSFGGRDGTLFFIISCVSAVIFRHLVEYLLLPDLWCIFCNALGGAFRCGQINSWDPGVALESVVWRG